ncbi:MAG TPA: hypothetical protein VK030_04945 [Actinomycetales bacterium]|nr:hypothetical protein [Actinomycetales bacterium]
MRVPITAVVNIGRNVGETVLANSARNKRRHKKHPERVLMPGSQAIFCWLLVVLWLVMTAVGWFAFDETADRGDLALRWAFAPFGITGLVLLAFYYNSYVETYDDHVVYRTWLRRVHRIDYSEITAYRIVGGQNQAARLKIWTLDGRRKSFQLPIFDMAKTLEYLVENTVENRTKERFGLTTEH